MSDTLGLFPERTRRSTAPRAKPEPVTLNPYKPRLPIPYSLATREEIIAGRGGTLTFDIECFSNFFLIAFKNLATQKHILFTAPFDTKKLVWLVRNYTCVGFNSTRYDMPLLWLSVAQQDVALLKAASNDLIAGDWYKNVAAKYGFTIEPTKHIDLIEVCPGHGSLKLYGARLHAERIQDLPFDHASPLEAWQKEVVTDYCINDLAITELMFNNLKEQLQLRTDLTKQYAQDLMSKSDAQIAEAVIGSELKRLTGRYPAKPKVQADEVYKFTAPNNLHFQSEYMQGILSIICNSDFRVDKAGYLIRPKEIENLEIKLGSSTYRMGIGGLHSSEKNMALVSDQDHVIIDRDVASYYPAIVINCQLVPKNLGHDFLTVYQGLIERRLAAKKAGNIAVSENLKVAINGTFGKTGSPYSILYAPEIIVQILLGGQLYLLMLIELIEAAGVQVVSANTDGFVMWCPKGKVPEITKIIQKWEQNTGFLTEETQYKAIYARDVNAYIAVKTNGEVKSKNIFYDPWRGAGARDQYWRFQKNPACQICAEAVERLVVDGMPVEQTIRGCDDVRKFLAIKNVTGGAHKNSDYLGKTVRWYYALGETGTINYVSNGRIVADTEGARPCMDLPAALPDDVDHAWYIRRTEEMLKDCGWAK